jgi:tetratricopeptide (TPR) repeat protein
MTGKWLVPVLAVAWLLAGGGAGCARKRPPELREIESTSQDVTGKEVSLLERRLPAGRYLVEVRERDVDVKATISAAGASATLESRLARQGVVFRVVSLVAPGLLRIETTSTDHRDRRGTVSLRISQWSRDHAPAGDLEAGYVAQSTAAEFSAQATVDSWAHAAEKMTEAVARFTAAHDDAATADAAYTLADIQYGPRDLYPEALLACDLAAGAYARARDFVGVANVATLRGAAEIEVAFKMNALTQKDDQQAMFAAADARLARAVEFFTAHNLPIPAQYAVNMRAVGAIYSGNYAPATPLLDLAVSMARQNRDPRAEFRSLSNLAAVDYIRGNPARSAREYAALIPLLDREHEPYQSAAILGNYGSALVSVGDFDRALPVLVESMEIFARLGEEGERATQLATVGGLYLNMGDAQRALETLRAAITEQERASENQLLSGTLRMAGGAASTLDQHLVALGYLRRAMSTDADRNTVAHTRVLIAAELRRLDRFAEAESELAAARKSDSEWVVASALAERGRLWLARAQPELAVQDLRAADARYASLGLEFGSVETKTALSEAFLRAGDAQAATAAADDAIAIVRRIHGGLANPEWRAQFLSSRYAPYEARIAAELSGESPQRQWRAFRIAEEVRARSLADLLKRNERRSETSVEEAAARTRLTALQLRLESVLQKPVAAQTQLPDLRRDIEVTRAQLDSIRARGVVAATQTSLPESLEDVEKAIPEGTVVLAYFTGDRASHVWLIGHEHFRYALLPDRKGLEASILASRREQTSGSVGAATRRLGEQLFGSLLDDISAQRLLVLADGPINGVAFAALPIPHTGGRLGVDRFVISNAPSLELALRTARSRAVEPLKIAIVSDPVYSREDRRLTGVAYTSAAEPGQSSGSAKLKRLVYSATEARAVAGSFERADVTELAGFDASAGRVLQLPSRELGVLHFATHAVARPDEPDQSALYLSEYTNDGHRQPADRVTADDIARSGLHANLVVLSGCATGSGRELQGEGVLGLTYQFLANGSNTVVASLWPVEDALTARFMQEFYTAYRATGRAPDALRTAQLRIRGTAATAVWASFVVRANALP